MVETDHPISTSCPERKRRLIRDRRERVVPGRWEDCDEVRARTINSAMARVIVRYLLDGLYTILFFAIMSAVALGANWIVIECEQSSIDPFVLLVLKGVSYMLVVLDGVGVVALTGLLTYSFIRATMRADD
jgi:hypothetical protein